MLRENLIEAQKTALKTQDRFRLSTLRLINSAIKDADIANRGQGKTTAEDKELHVLLARLIKQREESAKMYQEGGRDELAKNELREADIIREFLPRQLSDLERSSAIEQAISQIGAETIKDMGKVMAILKEQYSGQMDFSKASAELRAKLQG